jgi:lysophospholipase L1-like esterase
MTIDSSQPMNGFQIKQFALLESIKDVKHNIFNNSINNNIEFNLWESKAFTPIKELRALINQRLFNRIDNYVSIGTDGKYLLFSETIDKKGFAASSFQEINDLEIDTLVDRLNSFYFEYKKKGFDEVYLSIIPNPVTILYPNYKGFKYNNLIPRLQQNKKLEIKLIDVFQDFKNSPFQIYQNSDTHWNTNGRNLWLNKINEELSKY